MNTILEEQNSNVGPIRILTAALKRSIKTVTGYIFYHTNRNITNEKNYRNQSFQN